MRVGSMWKKIKKKRVHLLGEKHKGRENYEKDVALRAVSSLIQNC